MPDNLTGRLTPGGTLDGTLNNQGTLRGMLGGTGAVVTYASLPDKPSINGVPLVGNKTTSDLNISYNDLTDKPTIPDVGEIDERLDDLENDTSALDGRLTIAEGDITSLGGRVTTAEGNITTLQGDTGSLDTRLTTAEGDITTLQGDTGTLDTRLTTAEGDITTLQDGMATTSTDSGWRIINFPNIKMRIVCGTMSITYPANTGTQAFNFTYPTNSFATVYSHQANASITGRIDTNVRYVRGSATGVQVYISCGATANTSGTVYVTAIGRYA